MTSASKKLDIPRRQLVKAAAAAGSVAVAGCSGSSEPEGSSSTATPEDALRDEMQSVFDDTGAWVEDPGPAEIDETESGFEIYNSYWYNYISDGGPSEVQSRVNITATDLFESVYTTDYSISFVAIVTRAETVDEYGEEGEANFSTIAINSDTADRINWENFSYENLSDVADEYTFEGRYFR
jgi:hypothetical protein